MNETAWAKWSAIAEIVSSVAILVTLAYLAVQTQQNTDALLSQSRENLSQGIVETVPQWIQYPELSVLIIDETRDITLEQKIQLDSLLIMSLARREYAWHQYRDGLLDEASWQTELDVIALLVGTPRLRTWWEKVGKYGRDPGFVGQVDKMLMKEGMHPYWENMKNW